MDSISKTRGKQSSVTTAAAPDSPDEYSYPIHPAANIFPMMSAEEFEGLKKDIAEHGLKTFIALQDGKVIDGRNRLKACKELRIQPDFCEVENCDDPIAYVLSHNLYRRHLSQSQRAQCAAEVARLRNGERGNGRKVGTQICVPTVDDAAKAFSVSARSVVTAKRVADKGDKAVVDAVKQGMLSVNAAAKLVDAVPDKNEQRKIVRSGKKAVAAATIARKPTLPQAEPDDEPDMARHPEQNNAAFFLRQTLADGQSHSGKKLQSELDVPSWKTAAYVNEVPSSIERNRRLKLLDRAAKESTDETPFCATLAGLLSEGERIIKTTLHAMVWLGLVSMDGDGEHTAYRLTDPTAPATEEASQL